MSVCQINGTGLHYEEHGAGLPALFIHGMCGDANVWDGQVQRLSDQFRCIAYDRRGHSRSPLGDVTQRTVELHADDAAALIQALGIGPCLLVASSGGARVGVDLIRRYPALISSAVLSEPPIFGLDPEKGGAGIMAELQPRIQAAVGSGGLRAAVDVFFEYMCPGLWSRIDDSHREPYRANSGELLPDLQMPQYQITPEDIQKIQTPITMITGTISNPVLQRVARTIAGNLPNGRLVAMQGIGHVTYAEAPDEFAGIVREASAARGG